MSSPRESPAQPTFRLFGRQHLGALVATGVSLAALVRGGRRLGPVGRRRVRAALLAGLWGQEVAYHVWRVRRGEWTAREMLPLHQCSAVVWGGGLHLIRPTRLGDSVTWTWGMIGASVALCSPDLQGWRFPQFRFVQFFLSHGLVMALPLWNTLVDRRRPTWRGGAQAYGLLLALAGVASAVNARLGSNYLFIGRKLDTPSPLDWMPAWPRYIPILVVLMAGAFVVVLLPVVGEDDARPLRTPGR